MAVPIKNDKEAYIRALKKYQESMPKVVYKEHSIGFKGDYVLIPDGPTDK